MRKILLSAAAALAMSVSVTVFAGIDYSYDENSVSFNISKSDGGNVSWFDRSLTRLFQHQGHEFYK